MEKWTGDLQPPPFWLVPALEVTAEQEPPKMPRGEFVVACISSLLRQGLTPGQALSVAANTMNETGWGRYYRAFNLGGWKIWKFSSRNSDGTPRRWWRALGNKSSNDPQTCFYRAFESMDQFFAEWLKTFVPKVDPAKKPNGKYWKTGQQFWAGEPWFDDLIAAGYKGDVTRQNPEGSIESHEQIMETLLVMWCQHLLNVAVDGKWGPKSKAACAAYQQLNGLEPTGELGSKTLNALTGVAMPREEAKDSSPPPAAVEEPETAPAEPSAPEQST